MPDVNTHDLHPSLAPLYFRLIAYLTLNGIQARIIQGWRDPAYQERLVATGVSTVHAFRDSHCFTIDGQPASKAFDLGVFENNWKTYIVDGKNPSYAFAGSLWEQYAAELPALGLVWGGRFVHPKPDWDHFQIG